MIPQFIISLTSILDIFIVLIILTKLFGIKEKIKYPIGQTVLFSIIGIILVIAEIYYRWNHYIYLHGVDMLFFVTIVYSILFVRGNFFSKVTIISVIYCTLVIIYNFSYYMCVLILPSTEIIIYLIVNFIITRLLLIFVAYVILKNKIKSEYNVPYYYWGILILIPLLNFCVSFILEKSNVPPYKFAIMLIGMFIVNILLYIVFSMIINDYEDKILYLMDKQYLKLQLQSYEETQNVFRVLNGFKHDLKNHILCMQIMLKNNQLDELNNYFSQLNGEIATVITSFNTGSNVVDTVLINKIALAKSHSIPINIKIQSPIEINMMDFEISAVLSNLLDNAIEASTKIKNPEIKVKITSLYNCIIILISNRTNEDVLLSNPKMNTTKKDKFNHGLGISIVDGIIKKYEGTFWFYMENGFFNVNIVIPK